jgi:hypothetical protein
MDAASVSVPLESCLDRTEFLAGQIQLGPRIETHVFTANGTWDAPAGATYAIVKACGVAAAEVADAGTRRPGTSRAAAGRAARARAH